jgi:putative resolvase
MKTYVKAAEAAKYYSISLRRLRAWAQSGSIPHTITPGGHYRYLIDTGSEEETKEEPEELEDLSGEIIYTRVSSSKQKADLQRQIDCLVKKFPGRKVISDVGSGINYQRKGFRSILEGVFKGHIKTVVVAYQDRWSRFGFEFFQWLFQSFGAELKVVFSTDINSEKELTEDLMEIITVFTARYYGKRKYKISDPEAEILSESGTEAAS